MISSVQMRRLFGFAIVAFLLYFLVRSPIESAHAIRNVTTAIAHFANALVVSLTTFFRALF